MEAKELITGIEKNIPLTEKLVFSATPGIPAFYMMMASVWLLFFYTDILKISAAYVGTMFIAVSILTIFISPLFGVYLDRHETRWGKYKPWILIVFIGLAIGGFLLFLSVNLGQVGNTIYATITYACFYIFLSISAAPAMGMMASITKRQDDRMTIAVGNSISGILFAVIAGVASLPLVNLLGNGNQSAGFSRYMLIAMIIIIIIAAAIVKTSKERFVLNEDRSQFNMKSVYKTVLKNKYAMISIIYLFAIQVSSATKQAISIYYYKYYFNDANMIVLVGALIILPMIFGVFISRVITRRLGLKKTILSMIVTFSISSILLFFIPPTELGKIVFIALSMTGALSSGISLPAQGTMFPFAVDFGEWKFKTNSGGFLGSISGVLQAASAAIAGGIVACVLYFVKYVPEVQQTAVSLIGMRFAISVLPAALLFLLGLVILGWDMDEKKHREIIDEIRMKKSFEN